MYHSTRGLCRNASPPQWPPSSIMHVVDDSLSATAVEQRLDGEVQPGPAQQHPLLNTYWPLLAWPSLLLQSVASASWTATCPLRQHLLHLARRHRCSWPKIHPSTPLPPQLPFHIVYRQGAHVLGRLCLFKLPLWPNGGGVAVSAARFSLLDLVSTATSIRVLPSRRVGHQVDVILEDQQAVFGTRLGCTRISASDPPDPII